MKPLDGWLCSVGQEWTLPDSVRHFLVVYMQHWGPQGRVICRDNREQVAEGVALPVASSPGLLVLSFQRDFHIEITAPHNDFVEGEPEAFVLSVYLLCLPQGVMGRFPPPQERQEETATPLKLPFSQCARSDRRQERLKALGLSLWPVLACVLGHPAQTARWWELGSLHFMLRTKLEESLLPFPLWREESFITSDCSIFEHI